jgi:hypothetical protein
VAFGLDGRALASAGWDGTVRLWDVAGVREITSLGKAQRGVQSVAFRPDGRVLALAASLGKAQRGVQSVAFGPDGRVLASAGQDGTVRLWDVAAGREAASLRGHQGPVTSVAFGLDGRALASAGWDGTVRLWDVAAGCEISSLRGHQGAVWSVAFGPDGRVLASAGEDGTVRIWDAAARREAASLSGHKGAVSEVAFSPDGRVLASAGQDGTVRLWDATPISSDRRAHREAVGLVRFLVERVVSSADLRDRIHCDRTITEEVRGRALKLADGSWETCVRQKAELLVDPLIRKGRLRQEVVAALLGQRGLLPEIRDRALDLARSWPESAEALRSRSWAVARKPGGDLAEYQRAMRDAEKACEYEPDGGDFLNTLGVTQYRAEQYEKALLTLTRSNQLNGNRRPADLAFLAMTLHRLGRSETSCATLNRLRAVLRDPQVITSAEAQAFLREVEACLASPARELPDDVFTPSP